MGVAFRTGLVTPVKTSAFRPQAQSVPSDLMAKTVASPKPTSTQLVSGETRVGTRIWLVFWEMAGLRFCPQYQRLPSDRSATVSSLPAQTLVQFVATPTCKGTALLLVEPIPN